MTMTLLKILYHYFTEYDLEKAMKKVEAELLKLKTRILNGDNAAAQLAWVRLAEYDCMRIEFERRHFATEELFGYISAAVFVVSELTKEETLNKK